MKSIIFQTIVFVVQTVYHNVHASSTYNIFNDIKCSTDQIHFGIQFVTDNYPEQTSWNIINSVSGEVVFQSGPYTESNSFYKQGLCLQANSCYEFALYDYYSDGMATQNSIQIFYNEELVVEGSQIHFQDKFSLLLGQTCLSSSPSVSTAPSSLFSLAPSSELSLQPSTKPSSQLSSAPSAFLPTFNPTQNPTKESERFEGIIHTDNIGRRYFPEEIPLVPMFTYPMIPDCKETNNNSRILGCMLQRSKFKEVGFAPDWIGELHYAPPKCNVEKKQCDIDNGLPQPKSVQSLSQRKNKIIPVSESKYTESSVSVIPEDVVLDDTYYVALGDLNNDGWLDAIIGNNFNSMNKVLLNDGNGGFDVQHTFDLLGDEQSTSSIALGDVNNDGWLDIVVGNSGDPNWLLLNNGEGGFDERTSLEDQWSNTQSVALGDLDNDGWLDLIVGNGFNETNQLLFNDGYGGFVNQLEDLPGLDEFDTTSIAVGDVNKDGWLDIVVGNMDDVNQVLLNNGEGWFDEEITEAVSLQGGELSTNSIALGDINGDGWLDIVVGNARDTANQLLLNNGNGYFERATDLPGGLLDTQSVALGDVNNDGSLDVILGNKGGNVPNQLLLNGGDDFAEGESYNLPGGTASTYSVAFGDINNDGWLDIFVANFVEKNKVLMNNGDEGFVGEEALILPGGKSDTYSIALGDVNKDGWLDIIVGNDDRMNQLLLNDGNGGFAGGESLNTLGGSLREEAFNLPGGLQLTRSLAIGDVNEDGWLDVIVGNGPYTANQLLLNDRNGSFNEGLVSDLPGGFLDCESVTLGDVDNDGWLDIIIGNSAYTANQLLLNDGNGGFKEELVSNLPGEVLHTNSIALGDVNNDGWIDIIVGNALNNAVNQLLLNDGNGGFDEQGISILPGGSLETSSIALGDVNNDGWLDIVVVNEYRRNQLLLNKGNGRFDEITFLPRGSVNSKSVAVGDVNNDGWLDIIIGNDDDVNQLLLNDGSGHFVAEGVKDVPGELISTYSIALGDINRDGLVDIINGNSRKRGGSNTIIPSSYCSNGGAKIHAKSWCFSCPTFMGKVTGSFMTSCKECTPDRMQDPSKNSEECNQICLNKIRNLGEDECSYCSHGYYYDTSIIRDADQSETWMAPKCNPCPTGQYSNRVVLDECFECKPGTYQPDQGSTQCLPCKPGTYQPDSGSSTCISCAAGGYCNSTDATQGGFTPCPAGTYNENLGESDEAACTLCPIGTFNPEYSSNTSLKCLPCPSGSFSNSSGKD